VGLESTYGLFATSNTQKIIFTILVRHPIYVSVKGIIYPNYAAPGDEEDAREIYRELRELPDRLTPFGLLSTAELALSLGEVEECIDLLESLAEGGVLSDQID